MDRKIELRLLPSARMTEKGELNIIRFCRRSRGILGFPDGCRVTVGKGAYEASLTAKRAYREDIQELANLVSQGRLSETDVHSVGFVHKAVQQKVQRHPGNIWVTNGIGHITLGGDPEFGLVNTKDKQLVRGSIVLPDSQKDEFGADGPGVEVRPAPARSHIELVGNIQKILSNPPEAADHYAWTGGATFSDAGRVYWFGGHIHFGRPREVSQGVARPCYEKIATILDHLLAFPLVSFDSPNPDKRRNGCPHGYGKAGDIRDDYPEQDRFEYRVLSGLWLVHPTLAKTVLGTAQCIAESAYSHIVDSGVDLDFVEAPASRKGLLRAFRLKGLREKSAIINAAVPGKLEEAAIKEWESQLLDLACRGEYSEEITALIELVKASPEQVVPRLELDVRKNWQEGDAFLPGLPAGPLRKALEAVEGKT